MAARGFLGAGDLYIARYNSTTGEFDPFDGPFESTKFEIKPNSDLKEMSSRGRATYGQVIESVPLPKPSDLSVTLAEVNRESLAMALFGTASEINQGSGTISETIKARMGKWVQISKENLASLGFAAKDSAGTTTYTIGEDYEVNWRLGMIRCLSSGAITEGQDVKLSGTYNAITGTKISGATQSQVRAKFRLDGINFADQLPSIVDVWEAVLTPDNAFDFLADKFAEITLKGRLKTPAGKTDPFEVNLRDA